MTDVIEPVPSDYPGVAPYLIVQDPAAAIDFYKTAFGAAEVMRLADKGGTILHAEVRIGRAVIMLSGEMGSMHRSPTSLGGTPLSLCIYVPDVDAFARQAQAAGAEVIQPLETKFYGDRAITLRDPAGHVWAFMTRVENVSPQEMQRRMGEMISED